MRDHQALYSGAAIACRVHIGDLKTTISDQKGRALISDPSKVMRGQGYLHVDMRLPSLAYRYEGGLGVEGVCRYVSYVCWTRMSDEGAWFA